MIDISKLGRGFVKRYVGSRCVVSVIDGKGEAIARLHQKIQNDTKHINIMYTAMGGMGHYLYKMGKEMEYYADRLHQGTNALR